MSTPDDGARALLEQLAARAPASASTEDLARLMEGIAAAPEGLAGPEWCELVAPFVGESVVSAAAPASAELAKSLVQLRAQLASRPDGIEDAVPPRGRLDALRTELRRRNLDGFIVPRADEHQGEY